MALKLGTHPNPTQIADALVYVYGVPPLASCLPMEVLEAL